MQDGYVSAVIQNKATSAFHSQTFNMGTNSKDNYAFMLKFCACT